MSAGTAAQRKRLETQADTLTVLHGRDTVDVPVGKVLVEGLGIIEHCEEEEESGEKDSSSGNDSRRKQTHSLFCMVVTLPTFQLERSWLKAEA